MAAVEVAASSLYINAVSHLIILMTIRTTMLLLSAFSDVIMSRAKWIGFPLPTLSLYYNTYFQFFCHTLAQLCHTLAQLCHTLAQRCHTLAGEWGREREGERERERRGGEKVRGRG